MLLYLLIKLYKNATLIKNKVVCGKIVKKITPLASGTGVMIIDLRLVRLDLTTTRALKGSLKRGNPTARVLRTRAVGYPRFKLSLSARGVEMQPNET